MINDIKEARRCRWERDRCGLSVFYACLMSQSNEGQTHRCHGYHLFKAPQSFSGNHFHFILSFTHDTKLSNIFYIIHPSLFDSVLNRKNLRKKKNWTFYRCFHKWCAQKLRSKIQLSTFIFLFFPSVKTDCTFCSSSCRPSLQPISINVFVFPLCLQRLALK